MEIYIVNCETTEREYFDGVCTAFEQMQTRRFVRLPGWISISHSIVDQLLIRSSYDSGTVLSEMIESLNSATSEDSEDACYVLVCNAPTSVYSFGSPGPVEDSSLFPSLYGRDYTVVRLWHPGWGSDSRNGEMVPAPVQYSSGISSNPDPEPDVEESPVVTLSPEEVAKISEDTLSWMLEQFES